MSNKIKKICLLFILSFVVLCGCRIKGDETPQTLLGRWEVIDREGMNIPHSFFWLGMDYIEFRDDGVVLGLIRWPPGQGSDIVLNVTGNYELLTDERLLFTGSCRYQDSCAGLYTYSITKYTTRVITDTGVLVLEWVEPASDNIPQQAPGPMPTDTIIPSS